MTDPSIEREEEANEVRDARAEEAEREGGILGAVERSLSFVRERDDESEAAEEIDRRRANDEEQRA